MSHQRVTKTARVCGFLAWCGAGTDPRKMLSSNAWARCNACTATWQVEQGTLHRLTKSSSYRFKHLDTT
eukprot:7014224-Prorocentrum_lima.AAC.1